AGRTTGSGNRGLPDSIVRLGRLAPEDRLDLSIGEPREAHDTAARADRRQQAAGPMGDEQEEAADRRLLQAFQQGVGRALFKVVGRIDYDRTPRAECWPRGQPLLHRANLLDGYVAFGLVGFAFVALL